MQKHTTQKGGEPMPVESRVTSSKLQMKYNYGVDEKGNKIIKSKTYANVSNSAADEAIYNVASALSALQSNTLEEVHKVQDIMLIQL